MIKSPKSDDYKITDYRDLIGWEIQAVIDLQTKANNERIFYLLLNRLGDPKKTRRAYAEERYLPINIIYFPKR